MSDVLVALVVPVGLILWAWALSRDIRNNTAALKARGEQRQPTDDRYNDAI